MTIIRFRVLERICCYCCCCRRDNNGDRRAQQAPARQDRCGVNVYLRLSSKVHLIPQRTYSRRQWPRWGVTERSQLARRAAHYMTVGCVKNDFITLLELRTNRTHRSRLWKARDSLGVSTLPRTHACDGCVHMHVQRRLTKVLSFVEMHELTEKRLKRTAQLYDSRYRTAFNRSQSH